MTHVRLVFTEGGGEALKSSRLDKYQTGYHTLT